MARPSPWAWTARGWGNMACEWGEWRGQTSDDHQSLVGMGVLMLDEVSGTAWIDLRGVPSLLSGRSVR